MTLTQPQSKNPPSLLVVSGGSTTAPSHPYPTPSPSWTLPSPSYITENGSSAAAAGNLKPEYFTGIAPSPSRPNALATPQPSPLAATHKIATIEPRPSYLISPGIELNSYTNQGGQQSSSSIASGSVPAPWAPKPRIWNEDPLINKVQGAPKSPRETQLGSPIARMQSHIPQTQYLLPLMTATPSADAFAAAPPTFGGGLGTAFPEFLPVPSTTTSDLAKQDNAAAQHDKPAVGPAEYADVSLGGLGSKRVMRIAAHARRKGLSERADPLTIPQALAVYKHIRNAIPYIRSADMVPTAPGQSYRSVLDCASNAISILSGLPPPRARPPPQEPVPIKRARTTNNEKDKPATFCRGCGATETPEWRRGPLGPRTLCNACVSWSIGSSTDLTGPRPHEDDAQEEEGRGEGRRAGCRRRCCVWGPRGPTTTARRHRAEVRGSQDRYPPPYNTIWKRVDNGLLMTPGSAPAFPNSTF